MMLSPAQGTYPVGEDLKGCATYEFTVAGSVGPVLRAAFPGFRVTTVEPCLVIRTQNCDDRDLADLVLLLASAGGVVLSVHRLSSPE